MKIEDIIRKKGADVVTIAPAATVAELVDLLAKHNIGAVVVSDDGASIGGIVSERDIVRRLATQGSGVLSQEVSSIAGPVAPYGALYLYDTLLFYADAIATDPSQRFSDPLLQRLKGLADRWVGRWQATVLAKAQA